MPPNQEKNLIFSVSGQSIQCLFITVLMCLQSSESSPVHQLKRSNSTSTIYLHETVSQPNMKNTIKAVALAIYVLIKNRKSHLSNGIVDESDEEMQKHLEIFDEKLHPLTVRFIQQCQSYSSQLTTFTSLSKSRCILPSV